MTASAGRSNSMASASSTSPKCSAMRSGRMFFKLNCRQRDSTVMGTLRGSVVASRNLMCGGGSSKVFNSALKLAVESMCTSSMR